MSKKVLLACIYTLLITCNTPLIFAGNKRFAVEYCGNLSHVQASWLKQFLSIVHEQSELKHQKETNTALSMDEIEKLDDKIENLDDALNELILATSNTNLDMLDQLRNKIFDFQKARKDKLHRLILKELQKKKANSLRK